MYDDDLDDEYHDETWDNDDHNSITVPCCECRADIFDDTEKCPHCGAYQIVDTRPWSDKPLWFQWNMTSVVILLVLAIVAAYCAVFFW